MVNYSEPYLRKFTQEKFNIITEQKILKSLNLHCQLLEPSAVHVLGVQYSVSVSVIRVSALKYGVNQSCVLSLKRFLFFLTFRNFPLLIRCGGLCLQHLGGGGRKNIWIYLATKQVQGKPELNEIPSQNNKRHFHVSPTF